MTKVMISVNIDESTEEPLTVFIGDGFQNDPDVLNSSSVVLTTYEDYVNLRQICRNSQKPLLFKLRGEFSYYSPMQLIFHFRATDSNEPVFLDVGSAVHCWNHDVKIYIDGTMNDISFRDFDYLTVCSEQLIACRRPAPKIKNFAFSIL